MTECAINEDLLQRYREGWSKFNLENLKDIMKKCIETDEFDNLPKEPIISQMQEFGWDINEKNDWITDISFPHSIFFAAFIGQKYDLAFKLLELGARINEPKEDVVYRACECECGMFKDDVEFADIKLVKKLIEYGADVNACSVTDNSALFQACLAGDNKLVTLLIQHEAKVKDITFNYEKHFEMEFVWDIPYCPLLAACYYGNMTIFNKILKMKPELLKEKGYCWIAYSAAVIGNSANIIKKLHSLKADYSKKGYYLQQCENRGGDIEETYALLLRLR